MSPTLMRDNLMRVNKLLAGKTEVASVSYIDLLSRIRAQDVIYMDPPYQGVSENRNTRYCAGVSYAEFVEFLERLNERKISYLVSYDGRTGERAYGKSLPKSLKLEHIELNAGRSSQATLLGRDQDTIESLYLSKPLVERLDRSPRVEIPKKKEAPLLFDLVSVES